MRDAHKRCLEEARDLLDGPRKELCLRLSRPVSWLTSRAINAILNTDVASIEEIRARGYRFWYRLPNVGKEAMAGIERLVGGEWSAPNALPHSTEELFAELRRRGVLPPGQ